jgi:hypothetical protein
MSVYFVACLWVTAGEWILVQAHAHSHCLGTTASASFSGFPWGWVQRSQWVESLQVTHIFLRPIPTSLKEVRKYKFMKSVASMSSLQEASTREEQGSTPPCVLNTDDDGGGGGGDTSESLSPSTTYHEVAEEVVWYEQVDEASGGVYFYNGATGESSWEAPEWVVEYDGCSGIR